MLVARLFGLAVAILLCGAIWSVRAQGAETCHTPRPQILIAWYKAAHPDQPLHYNPRTSAIYHPISVLRTETPRLTWIGLAWLAPESGAVFAVDCSGTPLAAVSAGAVGNLLAGPTLPRLGQTVMFEYVERETGECVRDAMEIVAFRDNRLVPLWQHVYKQGMNVRGKTFSGFVSENYTLSFDDHGQTLRLTGERKTYALGKNGSQSSAPTAVRPLPAEIYRWNPQALRFLPERHYRQLPACIAAE